MQQASISTLAESFYTYYNPYGEGSPAARENWINFQNQATLARYHADAVGVFLERTSRDQIVALDRAAQQIDGTLGRGFAEVSDRIKRLTQQQERSNALLGYANEKLERLTDIGTQTNQLLGGVNQRLELLSLQLGASNMLLENVAELLRVPDSQKQRQHHIEMGLKFFKNASKDADLYQDALGEFLAAEKLLPTDYFVLRQIGLLYLYAPSLIDLGKASEYLSKAGKYSSVESDSDCVRIEYVLAKSISRSFGGQRGASSKDIALFAAEAYRQAATAQYALGLRENALKSIDKTLRLDGSDETAKFFRAKYLAALGRSDEALGVLKELTVSDSLITAVFGDLDLARETAAQWQWKPQLNQQRDAKIELLRAAKESFRAALLMVHQSSMRRAGFAEAQISKLLLEGGTVVAWGLNDQGQTTIPPGLSGVVAVAAGGRHSLALKADGTVVAWGLNDKGQSTIPAGLSGVVAVAAGENRSLALTADGTVVAWGDTFRERKMRLSGVVALAVDQYNSLAVKADGTVEAGGLRFDLGIKVPKGLSDVMAVAVGRHTLALKANGTVVAWGDNSDEVPKELSGVVALAASETHSLGLKADGTVVAWGRKETHVVGLKADGTVGAWGIDGDGSTKVPKGLSGVVAVAAGYKRSLALKGDGTVVAWGKDWDDPSGVAELPEKVFKDGVLIFDGIAAISAAGDTLLGRGREILESGCHVLAVQIGKYSRELGRFVTAEEIDSDRLENERLAATRAEAEKAATISSLLEQADAAAETESRKRFWQSKDYSIARKFYKQAVRLGSKEAKAKLTKLP